MYSYQKDRESFFGVMGRLMVTEHDTRALLRAASTIQRTAEIDCSFEQSEAQSKANERKSDSAVRRAAEIAARYGMTVEASGDPRGYTLKLLKDGREYGVPGRGLPARCFA